jgi:hypothetical protein
MISKVTIVGWQEHLDQRPVSLVHAIRRHAKLSLTAAKKLLDVLAEQGKVDVDIPTEEDAKAFVEAATSAGAIVIAVKRQDD